MNAPKFYVIPQQWSGVIDLLSLNQVEMTKLEGDTTIQVETYYIDDYRTFGTPYEGHYRHNNVKVNSKTSNSKF